jgi:uncharacterized repeat protein (TIGR01451 family)
MAANPNIFKSEEDSVYLTEVIELIRAYNKSAAFKNELTQVVNQFGAMYKHRPLAFYVKALARYSKKEYEVAYWTAKEDPNTILSLFDHIYNVNGGAAFKELEEAVSNHNLHLFTQAERFEIAALEKEPDSADKVKKFKEFLNKADKTEEAAKIKEDDQWVYIGNRSMLKPAANQADQATVAEGLDEELRKARANIQYRIGKGDKPEVAEKLVWDQFVAQHPEKAEYYNAPDTHPVKQALQRRTKLIQENPFLNDPLQKTEDQDWILVSKKDLKKVNDINALQDPTEREKYVRSLRQDYKNKGQLLRAEDTQPPLKVSPSPTAVSPFREELSSLGRNAVSQGQLSAQRGINFGRQQLGPVGKNIASGLTKGGRGLLSAGGKALGGLGRGALGAVGRGLASMGARAAAVAFFSTPVGWVVLAIIAIVLFIVLFLVVLKLPTTNSLFPPYEETFEGGVQPTPNPNNELAVSKTGPGGVNNGDDIEYEISVTYKGNADKAEVTVEDTIPEHTEFKEASDNGKKEGNLVKWVIEGLDKNQTKKVQFKVKAKDNDVWVINKAQAKVTKTIGGGGGYPPTADNCNGKYGPDTMNNPYKNFGDPQCDFEKDKLNALLNEKDSKYAEFWFVYLIRKESSYQPNQYLKGSASGEGAYGLYQMNPQGKGNNQYDNGTVDWRQQTTNAITYNNQLANGASKNIWGYWDAVRPCWGKFDINECKKLIQLN